MSFHALHTSDAPLILPNAWDLASALLMVEAGFPAVGTTSFGVAAGIGSPDAVRGTAEETRQLTCRLRTLPCYLTVDIEDGFFDDPAAVAAYAAGLGVAGINIEDSTVGLLVDPQRFAEKIRAIRDAAPRLFINARVDTFWLGQDASVPETLSRALIYVEAGADGVFVPGPLTATQIVQLVAGIPKPLNVLASATLTAIELGRLGVKRISTGSLPYRAALHAALECVEGVRTGGSVPAAVDYAAMQTLLARRGQ